MAKKKNTDVAVVESVSTPAVRSIKRPNSYIFRATLTRIKQDVLSWRRALDEVEQAWFPQRVKLQQLYQDVVLNAHIEGCMKKRKRLTLLKDFAFVNEEGKEDENLTKLFKKSWFKNYMSYALDAQAYGYSLISLGDIVEDAFPNVNVVKRWNVSPDRMTIQHYMYSIDGTKFNDPSVKDDEGNLIMDWVSWVGTPSESGISSCGNGYLYKVGLLEVFLRNLIGQNGDFVEMFAQPYRVGKTDKTEETERQDLEEALISMGSSGYAILDNTDNIEFLESKLGGNGFKGYDNFELRLEAKCTKVILGHAAAMDSTPGKLGNEDGVIAALKEVQAEDNEFFENHMNETGINKFRNLGFNIPFGYSFIFKNDDEKYEHATKENEANKAVAEIAKTMKDAGMEMDDTYFEERTNIKFKRVKDPVPVVKNNDFSKKLQNKLDTLYK